MVWIAIMVGIGLVVTLIGVAVAYKVRKEKIEPDYRTIFIMGIVFAGSGSAMISTLGVGSMGMFALGLIYMAIGLANRDKWKEQPKTLSDKSRKLLIITMFATILLVGLTLLVVFLIG